MRQWHIIVIGLLGALLIAGAVVLLTNRGGDTQNNPAGSGEDPFGAGPGDRTLNGTDSTDPFGNGATSSTPGTIVIDSENRELTKIYQPASAVVVVSALDNSNTPYEEARFTDRATGHIYSFHLGRNDGPVKMTNTTIPRLARSVFSNASSTAFQYLDTARKSVETFAGTLATPPAATEASPEEESSYFTLSGRFLPSGIEQVAYAPSGTRLAYVAKAASGMGSAVIVAQPDGTQPREIMTVPFTEVVLSWPNDSLLLLTTKTTTFGEGITYAVNPLSPGVPQTYLGGVSGLSVLGSPDGTRLLYSDYRDGITVLNVLSLENGSVTRLPMETLPEKCVWSRTYASILYCAVPTQLPTKEYADRWYRGEIHTPDLIWRVDINTTQADIVAPSAGAEDETPFDAVSLAVGPRDGFLTFIDRTNDTLYGVMLPTPLEAADFADEP